MSLEQQLSDLTMAIKGLTKAIEYHQAVIDEVENRKPEPKSPPAQEVEEKIKPLTETKQEKVARDEPVKKQTQEITTEFKPEPKALQDFCMKLVRKDTANAQKIRDILAQFEAKVISDVQLTDLPELAKLLSALDA